MINNYNVTDRNPRINKYKGLLLEDDRVPKILNEMQSNIEVASLSDIKEPSTNVIYKVPTINGFNKNYIFGQEFDIFTLENMTDDILTKILSLLANKGIPEEQAQQIFTYMIYFLSSVNIVVKEEEGTTTVNAINMYDDRKYILKNNAFESLIEQLAEYSVDETYDTIEELASGVETLILEKIFNNVPGVKEIFTNNNLEIKYTDEPLNDENLFLNVVERAKDTTYKYYIWNGEEYIEVFKDIEEKVIINKEMGQSDSDTQGNYINLNFSFTEEEFNLLKDNKAIVHLFAKAEAGDIAVQQDIYLLPSNFQKFKVGTTTDNNTITFISCDEYKIRCYYLYKNNLSNIYTRDIQQSVNLTPRNLKPSYYHLVGSNESPFLGVLENTNEDISTLYLNQRFKVYEATYNTTINKLRGTYDSLFSSTIKSLGVSETVLKDTAISIVVKTKLGDCSGNINLEENSGKTTLCLYDSSENKPIYMNVSFDSSFTEDSFITDFKVYKDGAEISADFLQNQFSSLSIYLL